MSIEKINIKEKKEMRKDYYLGLDVGTNSVGWAVTDEQYQLIKFHSKDLWGIREFEEAKTSKKCRTYRTNRRRREREKARINLLKSYFKEEIDKVDQNFFIRLDNSKYYREDKDNNVKEKYSIFDDENYTDIDYFKDFGKKNSNKKSTIFHLRSELAHSKQSHDVRLVYLALLNMFKHRGHFLYTGLDDERSDIDINGAYDKLKDILQEYLEINLNDINIEKMQSILSDRKKSKSVKHEELNKLFELGKKDKKQSAILKAIVGLNIKAKTIFTDLDKNDKTDINFSKEDFEEKIEDFIELLGEENFEIILLMKKIYDLSILSSILKDFEFLSDARINEYDKHAKDLKILKRVYKNYNLNKKRMFNSSEKGSYSAYVNSYNSGKKERRSSDSKGRKRNEFYNFVKKELENLPQDDNDVKYILEEISNEKQTFMPKQLILTNGVIPNQIHIREMKAILENAELYLPFLLVKDESGLTVSERILQLFSFQIPYYVGPVSFFIHNEKYKGNGWVVRKNKGLVLPWNIEDKIDMKATQENFINNLIRKCTYLNDEKVMPKASLMYEKFGVLNEINNLKIDGMRVTVDLKQDIYSDLFLKGKKVTKKKLINYLKNRNKIKEDMQLSGIDNEIVNSLSSYGKFSSIFGDKMKNDDTRKIVEEIIYLCTIFGDAKKKLKELLEEKYQSILSDKDIKKILSYKFNGWGKLSKNFLELPAINCETGEQITIIEALWDTNYNLMELINSFNFTFKEKLEEKQNSSLKTLSELEFEDLEGMYFSAPVKRMIWQTLRLIKEIEKIMDSSPKRVFIEMSRSHENSRRTNSRKKQLEALYNKIKKEDWTIASFLNEHEKSTAYWKNIINDADNNEKLRSKKLYLYFKQMGHSMYTGNVINLGELFDGNKYDIDHIYPRRFTTDNNIENNLVLVEKEVNAHKEDKYPLEDYIKSNKKVINLWKFLHGKGFMNDEKYRRLTSNNPLTDEQKANFIARQLVETRQGTKGIANLLVKVLKNSEIVYVKAGNVSDFRNQFNLLKSRKVNDFHHAHDAYLNIVIGNVYLEKFTKNPLNFINKEYNRDSKKNNYNLSKMFERDVVRNNKIAWKASNKEKTKGTIITVKKILLKNTPLMTRLSFEQHGEIADQTICSKRIAKNKIYLPLKATNPKLLDVTKYGGYNKVTNAYFFLVEHTLKKKRVRTLEAMPLYLKNILESSDERLLSYCIDVLELVEPSIRLKKIKMQSLIKVNGYYAYISGKSNNRISIRNAVNLCLNQKYINYIKRMENIIERKSTNEDFINSNDNIKIYEELSNKFSNSIFAKRPNPIGDKLISYLNKFKELSKSDQCVVIREILNLFAIGNVSANLELLGEAKNFGVSMINKKITEYEEFILINQSITGVYEKEIDLLKV